MGRHAEATGGAPADAVDAIDEISIHPFFLTFRDPADERRFRADNDPLAAAASRTAITFAAPGFMVMRLIVDVPAAQSFGNLLVAVAAVFVAVAWTRAFSRHHHVITLLALTAIGALSWLMFLALPAPSAILLTIAFVTSFLIGVMVVFRPRFPVALAWGIGYLVIAVIGVAGIWDRFGGGKPPAGLATVLSGSSGGGLLALVYVGYLLAFSLSVTYRLEYNDRADFVLRHRLAAAHKQSERLLSNILPLPVADRLKAGENPIADDLPEVSVVFADIVGFTRLASTMEPHAVLGLLNDVFSRFDALSEKHGLEKIKTIGNSYMAVAGAPEPRSDHAFATAMMALDMLDAVRDVEVPDRSRLRVRIGIGSGPAVAGVIGSSKFAYDLWGDTVNTASRMESHGIEGRVQVAEQTVRLLADRVPLEERGTVDIKGKGHLHTWLLSGRPTQPEPACAQPVAAPINGPIPARAPRSGPGNAATGDIGGDINMDRRFLTFADTHLEREFREANDRRYAASTRIAIACGAPAYLVVASMLVEPRARAAAVAMFFVSATQVLIAWTRYYPRHYDQVNLSTLTAMAILGWIMLYALPAQSALILGLGWMTLLLLWIFVFTRPRFPTALAFGAAFLATVVIGAAGIWDRSGEGRPPDGLIGLLGGSAGGSLVVLIYGGGFLLVFAASVAYRLERADRLDFVLQQRLATAKESSERLLRNVLPTPVGDRLKAGEVPIADDLGDVSVVFADIVGFTELSASMRPHDVVDLLNDVFTRFDALAHEHGLEKIKTIGDAYMAVAGAPDPMSHHANAAAAMALDMLRVVEGVRRPDGSAMQMRIGIGSGPAMAGVIGTTKFIYDLWGDAVNTASHMESRGLPGQVQVSENTRRLLDGRFVLEDRGSVEVKDKGPVHTWLLTAGLPIVAGATPGLT